MLQEIRIIDHGGYRVVRDDLIEGGTKVRALSAILENTPQKEVVYPADPWGYGGLALAEATKMHNKKLTLFYPKCDNHPDSMLKTIIKKHVVHQILENHPTQSDLVSTVEQYASRKKAFYIPIGFDFQQFQERLIDIIRKIPILPPEEVWVLAGSGCLARSIKRAWPSSKINAVSLGFSHLILDEDIKIYTAPEKVFQKADILPPYPSAVYYDAKLWRFVKDHAAPGALIWNVAG